MNYKVSILVAIYNVEQEYLVPCIDSLLQQTYTNLEIILVDDGSTDGSGAVIDSYTDPRIIKIHTPNQGVTAARKTGWLKSSGDYCLFVDGDDMLAPDAIAFFMEKVRVKEYDFISGWYDEIDLNGNSREISFRHSEREFSGVDYVTNSLRAINDFQSVCIGIYKRTAITEKAFDIDRKFVLGEDFLTLLGILNNVSTVLCTGHVFYHYVRRSTSVTKTTTSSLDYKREYYRKRLSVPNDKLKPLIYPHVLQRLAFLHINHAHREERGKRKKEYESLLDLKAAFKGKLSLRVRLEFVIMKSNLLSYLYRTVGWSLMSKIKKIIYSVFDNQKI